MNRAFPLQTLLDLSRMRLDEATRELGRLIASEQESTQRHALLVQYREEYQARFVSAAQSGLSPREWQNYRAFLSRLDEAIEQAAASTLQSRQRTAAGQQDWLAKQGKLKAFDTLSDRHLSRLAGQDLRREQKLTDEHAARQKDDGA